MTRRDRIAHMAATLLASGQHFTIEAAVSDAVALEGELERRLGRGGSELVTRETSLLARLTGRGPNLSR
jgi:hypothetical protein